MTKIAATLPKPFAQKKLASAPSISQKFLPIRSGKSLVRLFITRNKPVFVSSAMQWILVGYQQGRHADLLSAQNRGHFWIEIERRGDPLLLLVMRELEASRDQGVDAAKKKLAEMSFALSTMSSCLYWPNLDEFTGASHREG